MDRTAAKSSDWMWLASWTVASAVGFGVGLGVTFSIMWSVGEAVEQSAGKLPAHILGGAFFGLGLGLALGAAQALVLRQRGVNAWRWIAASMLGAGLAGAVAVPIGNALDPGSTTEIIPVLTLAFVGVGLGLAQGFAAPALVRMPLWLVGNAVGLAAAMFVGTQSQDGMSLGVVLGALLYGAITAGVLAWTARRDDLMQPDGKSGLDPQNRVT